MNTTSKKYVRFLVYCLPLMLFVKPFDSSPQPGLQIAQRFDSTPVNTQINNGFGHGFGHSCDSSND